MQVTQKLERHWTHVKQVSNFADQIRACALIDDEEMEGP